MKPQNFIIRRYFIVFCLATLICSSGALFAQKTHHFKPTKYYFTYDAKHEPVLKLKPGDTLMTSTLDAFGNTITSSDQKASEIVHLPKVNHQTGPFFVDGAEPGDILVIHLFFKRCSFSYMQQQRDSHS